MKIMNIIVYESKLPEKIKGMYFYKKRTGMVAINEKLSDKEKEEIKNELVGYSKCNFKCELHLI